jgi:hypothetical protein
MENERQSWKNPTNGDAILKGKGKLLQQIHHFNYARTDFALFYFSAWN